MDMILEVPVDSQQSRMDDPAVKAQLEQLHAFASQTGIMLGTQPVNGKRLVLAQAAARLDVVVMAIQAAGLPWVVVAAAAPREVEVETDTGVQHTKERYWELQPTLTSLLPYFPDVVEITELGEETSRRRPTVDEIDPSTWHRWRREWPPLTD